jgi:Domain of unknown function (DUF5916)/Carbohydrate family 9 binding domain-like
MASLLRRRTFGGAGLLLVWGLTAAPSVVAQAGAGRTEPSADSPGSRGGGERPSPPELNASATLGPMTIDGVLDEPDWHRAQVFKGFTEREPVEGDPAEFDTEVRVLFGDDAMWIGARMWDDDPQAIEARLTRRDNYGTFDAFTVMVDPNLDGLTGYSFRVSAANVQSDMYIYDDDNQDGAWDAVWSSAVTIDAQGWVAELRIPLSQIRYEASDEPQTWGINFVRTRVASNEESDYSLVSRLRRGLVSQMGRIDGLLLTHPARRIEVVPYVVSSLHRGPATPGNPFFDGTATQSRVGADVSYGLGAAFTLDATIDPDFGQVEADPAVINLSAFETFFPERRPFFVEDARIFDFSLSGGQNQLFYSRRVGRAPHGSAPSTAQFSDVPSNATILGAAKLTGRTSSGVSIGALGAVTAAEQGRALYGDGTQGDFLVEPRSEYGTATAVKDFGGGASYVGVLGTAMHRELPSDGSFDYLSSSAFSGGVRFQHQWSDRTWSVFGYLAGSYVRGSPEAITDIQTSSIHYFQRPDATRFSVDSTATSIGGRDWRLTLAKQNGTHWTGSVWAAEVSSGFEVNDVGFSTRTEVLDGGAQLNYREIRPGTVFRSYYIGLRSIANFSHEALDHPWSRDSWHNAQTGGNYNLNVNGQFLNYWNGGLGFGYAPSTRNRRATRGGPVMASPGAVNLNMNIGTDDRKRVSLGVFVGTRNELGTNAGGRNVGLNLRFQPSDNLRISLNPSFGKFRSSDQYVTATATLPYAPTYGTRYLFADLVQRELEMSTRVDWTFSPTLSLQLYAQSLVSSADYVTYKQLAAPGTFEFIDLAPTNVDGVENVDFNGDGTVDYTFSNRDFNVRSLIGNVVLRWEYRPGSTVFLVWQRTQSDHASVGDFELGRDARALIRAPSDDRFILKVNYWLGL